MVTNILLTNATVVDRV